MDPSIEIIGAILFAVALIHTFSTKFFAQLAHLQPRHAGLWHLLGEVEVVFGFWAFILIATLFVLSGKDAALGYLDDRDFTEPMFVFVIMVIAGSRPILQAVLALVGAAARLMPFPKTLAVYFLCLSAVPILGSFITEPAAMTLAAMLLRDAYFSNHLSTRLQYATLGVLFVNISIGGTFTNFAAPPVLMVAAKWEWDTAFMIVNFGWKAAIAVLINATTITWLFRRELMAQVRIETSRASAQTVPPAVTTVHLLFLLGVVVFSHYPVVFMGLFLFFLGFTEAYQRHQDRLILREGLLVAFFLAGLVTLGAMQKWWLQPALSGVDDTVLFFLAVALTAITDNAALTYLGSLVEGLTLESKYALVAGAVTGGGLTVIANAPNPAGFSILKGNFRDGTISPLGLLVAALAPTCVAIFAFQAL
ncbi:MAG: putative Na+/H+ antiporter [Nitrosospira sp.]|nr:putative Na+/H+ antiporter [Nitrosospira sp.]